MLSWIAFSVLVLAQGTVRLHELRVSRRHQKLLAGQGAAVLPEPGFAAMTALHASVFVGALAEVWIAHRPLHPWLCATMLLVLMAANALRWWVMAVLREHWNVRVVPSVQRLGVVTDGPYRLIRHPNYVAVFVELAALPLVHGAWITALAGAVLHVGVLARRLRLEESTLLADEGYRREMAWKPRFIPSPFRRRSRATDSQQAAMAISTTSERSTATAASMTRATAPKARSG